MACLGESGHGYDSMDEARCRRRLHGSKIFTQSPPNTRILQSRPRPGRRRFPIPGKPTITLLQTLVLLVFSTPIFAFDRNAFELRRPQRAARSNDILFDPRPIPEPVIYRRQFGIESSTSHKSSRTTSTSEAASPTFSAPATTTDSPSSSSTDGIDTAPLPSGSELPKAFDGGLGTNYTQTSCSDFLRKMISNDTFTSCLPFSLLLQNSMSFFTSSRDPSTLDPVLSASCHVNSACSSLMSSLASTLRNSDCSQDYDREDPTVRQAYNGLISYNVLYRAGCLKATPSPANNGSRDYCFTNAVTNTSSPTDSYIYYLPLRVPLPAGSMPTCSQCLKDTMGLFAQDAGSKSQPLSSTYVNAAAQVNMHCGPSWVNSSVPGASGSGGAVGAPAPSSGRISFAVTVASGLVYLLGLM